MAFKSQYQNKENACLVADIHSNNKQSVVHDGLGMHCLFFVVDMYEVFFGGKLFVSTLSPFFNCHPSTLTSTVIVFYTGECLWVSLGFMV